MRKYISTFIGLVLCICQLQAQGQSSFLLPRSASELAAGDVSPIFVQHNNSFGVSLSYLQWSPDAVNSTGLGINIYYKILKNLEAGIVFNRTAGQPYTAVNTSGVPEGSYTPDDNIAGLGVSYRLNSHFIVGMKGKYLSANLGENIGAKSVGIDLGVQYTTDKLTAEAGAMNLGSDVCLAKADICYTAPIGLKVGGEMDILFNGGVMAGIGLEYNVKEMAFIRCGYHYGEETRTIPSFASVGLGLKFFGISLDLAYLTVSDILGNSIMIGLGYSF